MSTARHMIALLKSHVEGDDRRFLSIAMQAAAHQARLGHDKVAQQLKDLIDEAKQRSSAVQSRPGQHTERSKERNPHVTHGNSWLRTALVERGTCGAAEQTNPRIDVANARRNEYIPSANCDAQAVQAAEDVRLLVDHPSLSMMYLRQPRPTISNGVVAGSFARPS